MLLADTALIDWVDDSAARAVRAAAHADPDVPIPDCGGWTMSDLVGHVAPFYSGWFRYNLRHPVGEGDPAAALMSASPLPDEYPARVEYLRDACAAFTSFARTVDLDAPVWAFWTTQPARFWLGRAATEIAIHAWDAQSAVGIADRIAADRAATSIDETLRGLWPAMVELARRGLHPDGALTPPGAPAGFAATDSGHRWRVQTVASAIQVDETDDLPAAVASGPGHDLVLYLWGRTTQDGSAVEVAGDGATVEAWKAPA